MQTKTIRSNEVRLILFFFISLVIFSPSGSSNEPHHLEKASIYLGKGEQRVLSIPNLHRFSIGDRAFVRSRKLPREIRDQADKILLKGLKVGTTDLWVWKKDGSSEHRPIGVRNWKSRKKLPDGLTQLMGGLQSTEVIPINDGFLVRGSVHEISEAKLISDLKKTFPKQFIDHSTLSQELLDSFENNLHRWLQEKSLAERLSVTREAESLIITGSIDRKDDQLLRNEIFSRFPKVQIHWTLSEESKKAVYFRVFLLEVLENSLSALGVRFRGEESSQIQLLPRLKNLSDVHLTVQALANEGTAHLLSSPEIVVQSPGKAELFSGGELPIQSKGRFYSNVSWRDFGLSLKIHVKERNEKEVQLEIETIMSQLDEKIASDQVPGIRSSRMKTEITTPLGRPVLLVGLFKQNKLTQRKGLPFLSDIPLLGSLFREDATQTEKTELVAILIPHSETVSGPTEKIAGGIPEGPVPVPRNWLSPADINRLQANEDFPWNVFE